VPLILAGSDQFELHCAVVNPGAPPLVSVHLNGTTIIFFSPSYSVRHLNRRGVTAGYDRQASAPSTFRASRAASCQDNTNAKTYGILFIEASSLRGLH
jgi:hypothetical protein